MAEELGNRPIDLEFSYTAGKQVYTKRYQYYLDFLPNLRKTSKHVAFNHGLHAKRLTKHQSEVCEVLKEVCRRAKANDYTVAVLDSIPGSGKSEIVNSLAHFMTDNHIPFRLVTYTGIASIKFAAHSLFGIVGLFNVKVTHAQMIHAPFHPNVRAELAGVKAIIVDEIFTAGASLVSVFVKRLEAILGYIPTLILVGDRKQMHPVASTPLYRNPEPHFDDLTRFGTELFHSAEFNLTLTEVVRQQEDKQFMNVLQRMRDWTLTPEDIEVLSERLYENLSCPEQEEFYNYLHIYATNAEVHARNLDYIKDLPRPVKVIHPQCTPFCSFCVQAFRPLYFSEKLRVMLLRNLCFKKGIVNGRLGELVHCYFDSDFSFPRFLTIRIDGYCGSTLQDKSIPIYPIVENVQCPHLKRDIKIKSFSLSLYYGSSVYKVQGLTIPKSVVDMTRMGRKTRLIYVAMSRMQALKDVAIIAPRGLDYHLL